MSWKTCSVFINDGPPGYLGTFPMHDAVRARALLSELGLGTHRKSRFSNFDVGVSPPSGWFCIGAYEKAALLAGHDGLYGCVEDPQNPLLTRCLSVFPNASVLAVELVGSVNFFAYSLYINGELQRALAGDADRGVVVDVGQLQPEEEPFFTDSYVRDGTRIFRWTVDGKVFESELSQFGERLVFIMACRFLGCPLDNFPAEKLTVEIIKKNTSIWPFSAFKKL